MGLNHEEAKLDSADESHHDDLLVATYDSLRAIQILYPFPHQNWIFTIELFLTHSFGVRVTQVNRKAFHFN